MSKIKIEICLFTVFLLIYLFGVYYALSILGSINMGGS